MEATALGIRPKQQRQEGGWMVVKAAKPPSMQGRMIGEEKGWKQRGGETGDECFKRENMKWKGEVMKLLVDLERRGEIGVMFLAFEQRGGLKH